MLYTELFYKIFTILLTFLLLNAKHVLIDTVLTFHINSPLEELLDWDSLSLSHSFAISAAKSGLLSCSQSGEFGSVGESCVKEVLIISDAGPRKLNRKRYANFALPLLYRHGKNDRSVWTCSKVSQNFTKINLAQWFQPILSIAFKRISNNSSLPVLRYIY